MSLRLSILLATSSLLFCSESVDPDFYPGYEFGEIIFPDEKAAEDLISHYIWQFEVLTQSTFGGPFPVVTFTEGVACTQEGDTYQHSIKNLETGECYGGVTFTCNEIFVPLPNINDVEFSALEHELLHCFFLTTVGKTDRKHTNHLWKDLKL